MVLGDYRMSFVINISVWLVSVGYIRRIYSWFCCSSTLCVLVLTARRVVGPAWECEWHVSLVVVPVVHRGQVMNGLHARAAEHSVVQCPGVVDADASLHCTRLPRCTARPRCVLVMLYSH